jgi:lipopolysaccharide export LptBFGC system permease protein LptF
VLLVSVLGAAATAHQVIVALPDANQTFREIAFGLVKEQVETKVKPRVFFHELPNRVIYVNDLNGDGSWRNVLLADTTQAGLTTVYFAREGRIVIDRDKQLVHLRLSEGTSHTTSSSKPEDYENRRFESISLSLDPKVIFPPPPSKGVPEMTFAELNASIAQAAARGERAAHERFMRSYKFALPATCFILALIGLALGATNRKDGTSASFAVGLGVILVYYVLLYGARSFANGGRINPTWAPWIPNLLMAAAGGLLLAWRARSADQPLRFSIPAFWRRRSPVPSEAGASPEAGQRSGVVVVVRVPHLNLPLPRILDVYMGRWRSSTFRPSSTWSTSCSAATRRRGCSFSFSTTKRLSSCTS